MVMSDTLALGLEHPGVFAKSIIFAESHANVAFSGLVILYLARIIYFLYLQPLHKVPGPLLARFSGI